MRTGFGDVDEVITRADTAVSSCRAARSASVTRPARMCPVVKVNPYAAGPR
jgi:hypothetical protein